MGYLICRDCMGYYKLNDDECLDDPQNLRFWDSENEVFERFDKCICGGELDYTTDLGVYIRDALIENAK